MKTVSITLLSLLLLCNGFNTHCDPDTFAKYGKVFVVGALAFTSAKIFYDGITTILIKKIKKCSSEMSENPKSTITPEFGGGQKIIKSNTVNNKLKHYYTFRIPNKKQIGLGCSLCFLGAGGLFASWKLSEYI